MKKMNKKELEEFKKLPAKEKRRQSTRLWYKKRIEISDKPCKELMYCPYGSLVEYMGFKSEELKLPELACPVFGHDCPVYKHAEGLPDEELEKILSKRKVKKK